MLPPGRNRPGIASLSVRELQLQPFVTVKCMRAAANICHRKVHACSCKKMSLQAVQLMHRLCGDKCLILQWNCGRVANDRGTKCEDTHQRQRDKV